MVSIKVKFEGKRVWLMEINTETNAFAVPENLAL